MKLAIIGAGAMGGSLAGHAARAGHDVTVVDVSQALIEQVNEHGLRVDTPEGPFTAHITATSDPSSVGACELVVIFVKAQHTEAAGESLRHVTAPETVVLTLQNGWGNAERLLPFVPAQQLVVGVTYNSCTTSGTGHVVHSSRGPTAVGPYLGAGTQPARLAADLLTGSGWQAEVSISVRTEIWKKLVLNAATLPTAALTRLSAGALGEPGGPLDLVDGLAAETVAVAVAQGLEVDLKERLAAIHGVLERAGAGKPSMLQDVLAGRKTEVETVNGAVVAAAADRGIPVPLNAAMTALIGGLERSYLP